MGNVNALTISSARDVHNGPSKVQTGRWVPQDVSNRGGGLVAVSCVCRFATGLT